MTKRLSIRPAKIAIIAVFTLGSTSGIAQDLPSTAPMNERPQSRAGAKSGTAHAGAARQLASTSAPTIARDEGMADDAGSPVLVPVAAASARQELSLALALGGSGLVLVGLGGLALLRRDRNDANEFDAGMIATASHASFTAKGSPLIMSEETLESIIAAPHSAAYPFATGKAMATRTYLTPRHS
ncbi:hypothetical protein PX699_12465 [Sphingobium sp. H39-3-25]|uniref:hypothetical protein n=1 Tax=Sphingobium arseniciresistens TaxID=3030834 RepID=UPI0023B98571|nr:hypothetical protein [Sphingobium arseniciresistens]